MKDTRKSVEKTNNLVKELSDEFNKLREMEEYLRPERHNFKVRLRLQMKQENKSIQDLKEEWEEIQQSIITNEAKIQHKYRKRVKELPKETQNVLEDTLRYYFELMFIVLKQYMEEIMLAIKELECQIKS